MNGATTKTQKQFLRCIYRKSESLSKFLEKVISSPRDVGVNDRKRIRAKIMEMLRELDESDAEK